MRCVERLLWAPPSRRGEESLTVGAVDADFIIVLVVIITLVVIVARVLISVTLKRMVEGR
jgi:hypothetical protein